HFLIDWELLDEYVKYITDIKNKYSIETEITLQDVTREELILIVDKETNNENVECLLLAAVEEACQQLWQMRKLEGVELEKDLNFNLSKLNERLSELKEQAPKVIQQYQEKLAKRMSDFLNGQVDETRLLTEVAVFADKSDINEEVTRLYSHINQFLQTLQANEPIGRKLDFILQEMNREVNTIGSKGNDSSIAFFVVEMKSLLEKMKEQVQNIE
ncbi:YicC/YloC family endoribonuclease, partial [Bacillus sp. JJ1503]|uniref:YicC/YloC family endoribonuclease n=1 Tax=Bacillus sp. JJ1503 TaxID=3122956 RepID=UPI002FFDD27E